MPGPATVSGIAGAPHIEGMSKHPNPETVHAAHDLLGHYRLPDGFHVGGFRASLFDTWAKADTINSARLAIAFPEIAPAVEAMRNGGEAAVRALAGLPAAA